MQETRSNMITSTNGTATSSWALVKPAGNSGMRREIRLANRSASDTLLVAYSSSFTVAPTGDQWHYRVRAGVTQPDAIGEGVAVWVKSAGANIDYGFVEWGV